MDCTSVKPGWYCGGEAGHEGPCAAWPPCWFCGYLGPGLQPLGGMTSVCAVCIHDLLICRGDAHGLKGDQIFDGTLWDRIKGWFRR